MAWTATLKEAPFREGAHIVVIVRYTDGTNTIDQRYTQSVLDAETIKATARSKVASLNYLDTVVSSMAAGDAIDLTPPAVIAPVVDAARAAWFSDYFKLQKYMRLVNLGLLAASDTRIVTLQTSLKANWLNTYFDGV